MQEGKVPEEADKVFQDVWKELFYLKSKWLVFRELFGDEENVRLLNQCAPATFSYFLYSLLDDINMSLTRLITDHASTGKRENSNFEQLIERLDPNQHQELIRKLEVDLTGLREKCTPFHNRRNRLLGHRDWKSVQPIDPEPIAEISRAMVEDILPDMEAFIENFYCFFTHAGLLLSPADILEDVRALLRALKAGQNFE